MIVRRESHPRSSIPHYSPALDFELWWVWGVVVSDAVLGRVLVEDGIGQGRARRNGSATSAVSEGDQLRGADGLAGGQGRSDRALPSSPVGWVERELQLRRQVQRWGARARHDALRRFHGEREREREAVRAVVVEMGQSQTISGRKFCKLNVLLDPRSTVLPFPICFFFFQNKSQI